MRAWLLSLSFLLILVALPLQGSLKLLPEVRLRGAERVPPKPKLSGTTLLEGRYVQELERWFTHSLGFRALLVRLDNQIRFSLFKEFSARAKDKITLGEDGWLFGEEYLTGVTRQIKRKTAERFAGDLKLVSNAIEQRGGNFIVLFSPSKAGTFPEKRPARYTNLHPHSSAYSTVRDLLVATGLKVVDGPAIFDSKRQTGTLNLFPATGAHWTLYGTCLVLARLLESAELEADLTCGLGKSASTPEGSDADLVNLANLLFPRVLYRDLYSSNISAVPNPSLQRARIVIIGSSFSWNLEKLLIKVLKTPRPLLLFYFRKKFDRPTRRWKGIKAESLDWERLLSADLVILEMNEAAINGKGYGFPKAALKYLDNQNGQP